MGNGETNTITHVTKNKPEKKVSKIYDKDIYAFLIIMLFSTSLKKPQQHTELLFQIVKDLFQQHKLISYLLITLIQMSRDTRQLLDGYQRGWML